MCVIYSYVLEPSCLIDETFEKFVVVCGGICRGGDTHIWKSRGFRTSLWIFFKQFHFDLSC